MTRVPGCDKEELTRRRGGRGKAAQGALTAASPTGGAEAQRNEAGRGALRRRGASARAPVGTATADGHPRRAPFRR